MKKKTQPLLMALLFSAVAAVSCSKSSNDATPVKPSLYERLGGTTKVADPRNSGMMIEKGRLSYRSVVDTTITLIVSDIQMNGSGNFSSHFAPLLAEVGAGNTTNVAVLSKNLTDFFCANTGGGGSNTYTGLDMAKAHNPAMNPRMGAKVTNANYDKFIGFVGQAAQRNGVTDQQIIQDVVAVLESLRAPIVQAP